MKSRPHLIKLYKKSCLTLQGRLIVVKDRKVMVVARKRLLIQWKYSIKSFNVYLKDVSILQRKLNSSLLICSESPKINQER